MQVVGEALDLNPNARPAFIVQRRAGDPPLHRAVTEVLASIDRTSTSFSMIPWYLSTYLPEEGCLAALTGDTTGAVQAYGHYLALRPDPEPWHPRSRA